MSRRLPVTAASHAGGRRRPGGLAKTEWSVTTRQYHLGGHEPTAGEKTGLVITWRKTNAYHYCDEFECPCGVCYRP